MITKEGVCSCAARKELSCSAVCVCKGGSCREIIFAGRSGGDGGGKVGERGSKSYRRRQQSEFEDGTSCPSRTTGRCGYSKGQLVGISPLAGPKLAGVEIQDCSSFGRAWRDSTAGRALAPASCTSGKSCSPSAAAFRRWQICRQQLNRMDHVALGLPAEGVRRLREAAVDARVSRSECSRLPAAPVGISIAGSAPL